MCSYKNISDFAGTKLLVEELQSQNQILFFEPSDDSFKNFMLGIMSDEQMEMLLQHGPKGIHFDSTHQTNRHVVQLTTLMVIDDQM